MTLFTAVARQRAVLCKTNLLQSYVTCYCTTETVYNKLPSACTFQLQTSSSEYSYYIWYSSKVTVKQVKLLYVTRVLATIAYDGMEEQLHTFFISALLTCGKRGPQYAVVSIWVGPIVGLDLCARRESNSNFSVVQPLTGPINYRPFITSTQHNDLQFTFECTSISSNATN